MADLPPPHEDLPPDVEPEPDCKLYESAIAEIEESCENCEVKRNYKPVGKLSGVQRQVDVWLSTKVGDDHEVTVAIECRRYNKPIAIKDVEAFVGFLEDVGANKGVMISHSGYTDGAQKRAKAAGIELKILTLEEAEDFDWDEFVRDPCQVGDCFGNISWAFSDGGSEAGYCDTCGSFHIRCGNCGELSWYNEGGVESCSGCDMSWSLQKEKGETVGIKELPPEEEPDHEEEEE
jgi:hypothetical protein